MTAERAVLVNGPAGEELSELVRQAVLHTLDAEGASEAEISVTLLADDEIRAMNRQYLSRDRVTDVIAFSLGGDAAAVGEEPGVLGDVYIGFQEARRQAEELGIAVEEEVARLAIHGTLHVLGHDHPEKGDRDGSPMYRLQERLLRDVLDRR